MYSVYSRVLKLPMEIAAVRKYNPLIISATSKVLPNFPNETYSFHRNNSTDSKAYEKRNQLQYLGYSLLVGAVAYTSFKLW